MGSLTTPGLVVTCNFAPPVNVVFPLQPKGRQPVLDLRSSIPSEPLLMSTLQSSPHDRRFKTRSQNEVASPFLNGSFIPYSIPVNPSSRPSRPPADYPANLDRVPAWIAQWPNSDAASGIDCAIEIHLSSCEQSSLAPNQSRVGSRIGYCLFETPAIVANPSAKAARPTVSPASSDRN